MELQHTTFVEMPLCSCGCGERVVRNGVMFIHGHHRRGVAMTQEHKDRISVAMKGQKMTPEQILINSQSHKGKVSGMKGKEVCLCYYGKDRNAEVAKVVSVRFVDESKNMRTMNSFVSEILKVAKSMIAVSCLDGMPAPKAKRTVNAIIARHTNGFFRDDSWENVQKIWNDFRKEGIDWSLLGAQYSNNSEGTPTGKTWKFQIDWLNEKGLTRSMFGVVIASGAGSTVDPLERYDLVGYVS